jgi:transposase-like protein
MPDSTPRPPRRAKRFLSAEQKYEIWLKTLTGEWTSAEAAARAGVDRGTIMTLRKVAKDGAIAALQGSTPGRPRRPPEDAELAALRAENARLQATVVELSIENVALRGKAFHGPWRPPGPDEILGGRPRRRARLAPLCPRKSMTQEVPSTRDCCFEHAPQTSKVEDLYGRR